MLLLGGMIEENVWVDMLVDFDGDGMCDCIYVCIVWLFEIVNGVCMFVIVFVSLYYVGFVDSFNYDVDVEFDGMLYLVVIVGVVVLVFVCILVVVL